MNEPDSVKFQSAAATHIGMVRELNEDSYLDLGEKGLWVVADGMGGHEAGERASRTVIDSLTRLETSDDFEDSLLRLQSLIYQANETLVDDSRLVDRHRKPGSTVVTLLIQQGRGAAVWAGDSRLYRLRSGTLEQLTRDHSHVQDLVDRKLIKPEAADKHPMANVITRAVGIDVPMELETRQFRVLDGDRFLLCSDGLSQLASEEELSSALAMPDPDVAVEALLQMTLERGAPDNVTVICVITG